MLLKQFHIIGEIASKPDVMFHRINNDIEDYKPYFLTFLMLIAPIIEEFAFRLSLVKFNVRFVSMSISLITGLSFGALIVKFLWMPHSYWGHFLIYYCYMFLFVTMIYFILNISLIKSNIKKIEGFWNVKPGFIYYTSAFLFAIIHISNYDIKTDDLIYLPLILLPYFIYGLSFGYLRIRIGLIYSIAMHVTVNGLSYCFYALITH